MVPCLYTRISILLSQLPILIPRFLGPIISSCSSPDSTAMLRSTLESVLFMIDDLSNTRHKHIIEGRTELHKLMANSRACRLSSRRDPPQQSTLLRRSGASSTMDSSSSEELVVSACSNETIDENGNTLGGGVQGCLPRFAQNHR